MLPDPLGSEDLCNVGPNVFYAVSQQVATDNAVEFPPLNLTTADGSIA